MKKALFPALLLGCALAFGGCSSDDAAASGGNTCHDGCVAVVAAHCSNGPADQASCESDCNGFVASKCSSQFAALQSCDKGKPITCDADGNPIVAACSTEQDAFVACLIKG
jgi:hypothetical protein